MSGWYKRQRNITERPWFKEAKVLQLFDFLEATAYVADGKYEGQIIRRGSLPTTRPEMMEATGLSYKEVDLCLRKLVSYGEIVVKGYYRFSVVTICSYDSLDTSVSLFGTTEGTAKGTTEGTGEGTTEGTTGGTTHISTIEERINKKDNLISPYSPYKNERERREMIFEIKKRYNKTFDGKLPPLLRLHEPTRRMVEACIERFGLQSVDRVFEQVLSEPFSLGQNKTGFIASFQYIFEPRNFQQYLERAMLKRIKTKEPEKSDAPEKGVGTFEIPDAEAQAPKTENEKTEEKRQQLLAMVEHVRKNPASCCKGALVHAYNGGMLRELGIDWTPKTLQNP